VAPSERYPRDVAPVYPGDLEIPVEQLLAAMSGAGVERCVLVPLSHHDEYLRECLRRYPGVFAGVGVHHPSLDYRRRVEESGLQGVRVHDLDGAFGLLETLAELGHVLWCYVPEEQFALLEQMLEELPDLKVVLNHLGFPVPPSFEPDEHGRPDIRTPLPPPTLPFVQGLARFGGVHVMLSGQYAFSREPFPHDDLVPTVHALYEAFGAQRMLWASDFPWIRSEPGYERQVELPGHALPDLTPDERDAIFGGTVSRLFRF
jgi:predicted TIM-barrel fold metal-dependent hydrolase